MKKYLVVWSGDDGVIIQSLVETDREPGPIPPSEWVKLAALSEDHVIEDGDTWDVFLVIDFPAGFYI